MKKILVLGANGMLGAMLVKWFSSQPNYNVTATTRSGHPPEQLQNLNKNIRWIALDADSVSIPQLAETLEKHDFAINAIGKIKQKIRPNNLADCESTIRANALFPIILGQAAEKSETKVIQIATDCVYTGVRGNYHEDDLHDANDIYGRSKSVGEVVSKNQINLRCSVIGPELDSAYSLLSWFLSSPSNASLSGFSNHVWNGVTSLHFAKICQGIIEHPITLDYVAHIVPANTISKDNLLRCFASNFNRPDVTITSKTPPEAVDRTLITKHPDLNIELWRKAGHDAPPTIEDMIAELAHFGQIKI